MSSIISMMSVVAASFAVMVVPVAAVHVNVNRFVGTSDNCLPEKTICYGSTTQCCSGDPCPSNGKCPTSGEVTTTTSTTTSSTTQGDHDVTTTTPGSCIADGLSCYGMTEQCCSGTCGTGGNGKCASSDFTTTSTSTTSTTTTTYTGPSTTSTTTTPSDTSMCANTALLLTITQTQGFEVANSDTQQAPCTWTGQSTIINDKSTTPYTFTPSYAKYMLQPQALSSAGLTYQGYIWNYNKTFKSTAVTLSYGNASSGWNLRNNSSWGGTANCDSCTSISNMGHAENEFLDARGTCGSPDSHGVRLMDTEFEVVFADPLCAAADADENGANDNGATCRATTGVDGTPCTYSEAEVGIAVCINENFNTSDPSSDMTACLNAFSIPDAL